MATKKYRPITPGMRNKTTITYDECTVNKPNKGLVKTKKKSSGRNNYGNITVRHQGGGVKRKFRSIDFKRNSTASGYVETIEYDPNRTALICLVKYLNGDRRYILAPKGIKVGDIIEDGDESDINLGVSMSLAKIPVGSQIHNIELLPGKGAQLVRSAGASAVLMAKSNRHGTIKLPSGEIRLVLLTCKATYGRLSNEGYANKRDGKAGIKRKRNIRPTVRGAVMNAADHKHGGGEGRAPVGLSEPRTAYGKKANIKTRGVRKRTKHVVRSRKR
ncbi:MAG: 50S ribosomal protein L2 [Candidatus Margulisiibacteriota bacterium]